MRGVYSMGALSHLEKTGLRCAFDLVVGSSAGAINGAYLLAGQAIDAVRVYVDNLSTRNFVNLLRLNRIVDIDYMVDVALKKKCPLDLDTLHGSPCLLQAILTDAETGEATVFTNRDNMDIYEVIRATAALPALYNRKVKVGDRAYIDGGLSETVPVQRALAFGAEFSLVVLTRQAGFRRKPSSAVWRFLSRLAARGQSTAVRSMIGSEDVVFSDAMNMLENQSEEFNLFGVWPSDMVKMVGRTTNDRSELEACAAMGERDMQYALDAPIQSSR
jgi:predicted patatin/cPLA2 family phospholipase